MVGIKWIKIKEKTKENERKRPGKLCKRGGGKKLSK